MRRSRRFHFQVAVLLASLAFILAMLGAYAYAGMRYSRGRLADRRQMAAVTAQLAATAAEQLQPWLSGMEPTGADGADAFRRLPDLRPGVRMPPGSMAGVYRASDSELLTVWPRVPGRPFGPRGRAQDPGEAGIPAAQEAPPEGAPPEGAPPPDGPGGPGGPPEPVPGFGDGAGRAARPPQFGPRGGRRFGMPPREREALVRLCEQAVEIEGPTYEFLTRPGSALLLYAQPLRVGEKIVGAAWSWRWLPETPVGALSTWALPATIAAALVGITVALWTAIQLQRGLMRMQAGLELGREMIASLMPAEALVVQGYEIARRVEPATEVGGDFYNLFPLDGQHVGVVLGDIAGKGVAAALGMAVVTTLLEEQARAGLSPADVLARSSQKLAARLRARRTFATAVYGRLDLAAHTISLCSAGQTPCIWLRGGKASYVRIPGTPLGRIGDGTYQEETLELSAGDTLVFSTDGFVEMRNGRGRPLGYDGWLKLVEQHRDCAPGEMVERLFAAVGASMQDPSERDDLTLLVLRRNG